MSAGMAIDATADSPRISGDDFRKFRDFFYRKTGIYFDDSKRYFVDKRIADRIGSTGSEDFQDYFRRLRYEADTAEMQALVNVMTVNETYFMREDYQFRCMTASLLPELVQTSPAGRRLRIWSMPSSSGEEPYSIAIHLLENWPGLQEHDVEIIASDIDTRILDQARNGIYGKRAVQYLSPRLLERYFQPHGQGNFQVCELLRESVRFSQVNLNDARDTASYKDFDIIFCRNLLIYFDDASRASAAQTIFHALRPGGFICLGHSESMARMSTLFKVRRFADAIVYQKPLV